MTFSACCEDGVAGGDAALERLVAPVQFGELLEVAGGELVRHDAGAELGGAEDVIPVGMGQDHVTGLRDSVLRQERQELAGMRC